MQVVFRSLSSGGQSLGKAADLLSNDNTTVAPLLSDFGDAAIGGMSVLIGSVVLGRAQSTEKVEWYLL